MMKSLSPNEPNTIARTIQNLLHTDAATAARQAVIESLQVACQQIGVDPKDNLPANDVANVITSALRNLVLTNTTLDVSIYMLATEAYSMKIWLAAGMNSWSE